MFPSLSCFLSEHTRSLRETRKARLFLEELETRTVPSTTVPTTSPSSSANNPSPAQFSPGANNQTVTGVNNQNINPQSQAGASSGANSNDLLISTVPAITTIGGTFALNNNLNPGAVPNSNNPGDTVTVYTGNIGAIPADGSDTSQIGSQTNLLGITPIELTDLTGPTPETNTDVAEYLQAVARPDTLSPLRNALLTVEQPDGVGSAIGQEASGGQPIEEGQGPQAPPNGQGGQGAAPQSGLDIPAANLQALLESPPPINGYGPPPVQQQEQTDNVPHRVEEAPTPASLLSDMEKLAIPEPDVTRPERVAVWEAYFAKEGHNVELEKLVKMPDQNHYEPVSLPWHPPALGLALFLGGWASLTGAQVPGLLPKRRLVKLQWREER